METLVIGIQFYYAFMLVLQATCRPVYELFVVTSVNTDSLKGESALSKKADL